MNVLVPFTLLAFLHVNTKQVKATLFHVMKTTMVLTCSLNWKNSLEILLNLSFSRIFFLYFCPCLIQNRLSQAVEPSMWSYQRSQVWSWASPSAVRILLSVVLCILIRLSLLELLDLQSRCELYLMVHVKQENPWMNLLWIQGSAKSMNVNVSKVYRETVIISHFFLSLPLQHFSVRYTGQKFRNTSSQLGPLSLLISQRYKYVTFNLCFSSIDVKETHLGDLLLEK